MSSSPYSNPVTVIEGAGVFKKIVDEFLDSDVTIITSIGTRKRFLDTFLNENGLNPHCIIDECIENPTFSSCRKMYAKLDHEKTDKIIAIGGGSVLDAAKVVSLYDNSGLFEPIEIALKHGSDFLEFNFTPLIAVPTTAGTGSEVTSWGTVWDDIALKKYSMANPLLYPLRAYCDAELTLSLSWSTTLATALDALSHAMESIWNLNASYQTKQFALKAIELVLENLEPLSRDLGNITLRSAIMSAAINAGLGFSNTKTSVAHAISYYLTLRKKIPHGRACSFSLPHILKVYLEEHDDDILTHEHLAEILTMFRKLNISTRPQDYGIARIEFDDFFNEGTKSDRMKNSLVNLPRLREELLSTYSSI